MNNWTFTKINYTNLWLNTYNFDKTPHLTTRLNVEQYLLTTFIVLVKKNELICTPKTSSVTLSALALKSKLLPVLKQNYSRAYLEISCFNLSQLTNTNLQV